METILLSIIKSDQLALKLKRSLVEKLINTNEIEIVKYEEEERPERVPQNQLINKLNIKKYFNELEEYFIQSTTIKKLNCEIDLKNRLEIIKYVFQLLFNMKTESTKLQIEAEYKAYMHIDEIKKLFERYVNLNNAKIEEDEMKTFNFIIWLHLHLEICINRTYLKYDLMQCIIIKLNNYLTISLMLNKSLQIAIQYSNLIECIMPIFDIILSTSITKQNDQIFSQTRNNFLNYLKEFLFLLITFLARHEVNVSPDQVQLFLQNLGKIVKLVIKLMEKTDELFQITMSFLIDILKENYDDQELIQMEIDNYEVVKKNSGRKKINNFLSEIFKYINTERANEFIRNFIINELSFDSSKSVDSTLRNILFNFSILLSWPFYSDIDVWFIGFMKVIASCSKYSILIEFYEEKLDYILDFCQYKLTRKSSMNMVSFCIINVQHSSKLFHQACAKISLLLSKFLTENDLFSFKQFSYLCTIGMTMFVGYPEIYQPLIDIIEPHFGESLNQLELAEFQSKFLLQQQQPMISNYQTNDQNVKMKNDNSSYDEYLALNCVKLKEHLTGLINLGNTCYLNSILQVLYSCKKFVTTIINLDLNVSSIMNENKLTLSFIYQLKYLFFQMYLTSRPAIRIKQFVEKCTPNWFNFGQQQDCSEYLIYLLDNLNEELKRLKSSENDSPAAATATLLEKLFNFRLSTECVCFNCKTKTVRNDDLNYILPLSFPPQTSEQPIDLQILIDNYFKSEELNEKENNLYSCNNCKSLQTAHKTIKLVGENEYSLPVYQILTLNRFQYERVETVNEVKHVKMMQQLNYNSVIRLNAFKPALSLNECETVFYRLISICIHSGSSLHHGHYYSYIIDHDDCQSQNPWLLANDEQVSLISYENLTQNLNKFKTDTPYLLVYEKISNVVAFNNESSSMIISEMNQNNILNKTIVDLIGKDNKLHEKEFEQAKLKTGKNKNSSSSIYSNYRNNDDNNDEPPDFCNNNSHINDGPRFVF